MPDHVCGPAQVAALTRAVASAHRERDGLVLVANLRDLASASLSWAAHVERFLAATDFTIPEGTPRKSSRRADAPALPATGRSAVPRPADPTAGEAVRAEVIA